MILPGLILKVEEAVKIVFLDLEVAEAGACDLICSRFGWVGRSQCWEDFATCWSWRNPSAIAAAPEAAPCLRRTGTSPSSGLRGWALLCRSLSSSSPSSSPTLPNPLATWWCELHSPHSRPHYPLFCCFFASITWCMEPPLLPAPYGCPVLFVLLAEATQMLAVPRRGKQCTHSSPPPCPFASASRESDGISVMALRGESRICHFCIFCYVKELLGHSGIA